MTLKIRLSLSKCPKFTIGALRAKLCSIGYSIERVDGKMIVAPPETPVFFRASRGIAIDVSATIAEADSKLIIEFPVGVLIGTGCVALATVIGGLIVRDFKDELGMMIEAAGFLTLMAGSFAYFSSVMKTYADLKKAVSSI
jgi:hypothetical protein